MEGLLLVAREQEQARSADVSRAPCLETQIPLLFKMMKEILKISTEINAIWRGISICLAGRRALSLNE